MNEQNPEAFDDALFLKNISYKCWYLILEAVKTSKTKAKIHK